MKIRCATLFVCLSVLLVTLPITRAQAPDSNPQEQTETQEPQEIPHRYDEITVTATRTPTASREIGQALTVISSEDMETQGARDILQVLETVPGLNVVRTGSFGSTASVFVRGGESDFNLVLIDGVQVNQPGGGFDFADLTTTNVERIEIVRGPSSVLYGADATASVINIITRKGEEKLSGNAKFEGGSFDSYLFRGALNGELDWIQYSLGTHYSDSDGFYDFNNQYDKIELSVSTVFKLPFDASITANARYFNSEHHFPTDAGGQIVDPNDFRQTNETLYSISYEDQLTDRYTTRLQYGFYRRDYESYTVEDGVVDFFNSTFEIAENRNYLDWQNNIQLNSGNLLTAGASFEREQSETEDLGRRSVGFYLQDQFSWGNRLFLTAGGRYDHNNRFQSFATGSLSAAYLLTDQLKIRSSIGNGLRAPSFFEIIGFPDFGIVGNPSLNPEKNLGTDFGFDYFSRSGRGGVAATLFFNRFSDLIEFTFLVPTGTPNYLNIEKAQAQGLELDGFITLRDDLRMGAHYTFADTEVTDAGTVPGGSFVEGQSLLRRPRHGAGLYAQFARQRYRLRIDFKFKGERDDVQVFPDFSSARVVLPSYWKTDFGVTLPLLQFADSPGDVAVVFRGENIFNRYYTEIAGFPSVGRSFFAGLEVAF